MKSRLDIYKTPRGWRVGIWSGSRRVRWPKYYLTQSRAANAYACYARAHGTN